MVNRTPTSKLPSFTIYHVAPEVVCRSLPCGYLTNEVVVIPATVRPGMCALQHDEGIYTSAHFDRSTLT